MYRLLHHHIVLSEKRSPIWSQNKVAKILVYFMSALVCLYLIGASISLAAVANDDTHVSGGQLLFGILPFILTIDFFVRFIAQQTPSQLVKPYILLPIQRYSCVNYFVLSSLLSWGNYIWFTMLVPYLIMAVIGSEGLLMAFSYLLVYYILILINSQWYLISRTLINNNILWWLMPAALYALIYAPLYISGSINVDKLCSFYSHFGDYISTYPILSYGVIIIIAFVIILLNRRLQYIYTWKELGKSKNTTLKTVSNFSFLDIFGQTGVFLELEMKSILRNKNIRKTFISAISIILLFSIIISTSSTFDGPYMTSFWIFYNFAIIGAMIIIKVMGYEGNYIESLLVHKENLLSLLKAKYYFYSTLLIIPFILMLPTVFTGKTTILQLTSVMVFTAGLSYFLFFQMAIYNKVTIPLNTKLISKGGIENNYVQVIAEFGAFLFPTAIYSILYTLVGNIIANIVLLITGLVMISIHQIWIKYIYIRMMNRKYNNLEGFRSSRK